MLLLHNLLNLDKYNQNDRKPESLSTDSISIHTIASDISSDLQPNSN